MQLRSTLRFFALVCLLAAQTGAPGDATLAAEQPKAARPNIVVILVDDMGYSDLGCYGSEIETPNLDRLAANGVRFTQFYNTARCCPTRAALLTGLYQHQAGIGHMTRNDGLPGYQGYLNDRCVTLAEALKPAGYTTLMVGKWHVGGQPGQWPLDRGFERYWGTPTGGGVYFKDTLKIRRSIFFVADNQRVEPPDDMYVTDTFTDRAIEFVDAAVKQGQQPFFLYLAHIAPHFPLQAKPSDIAKYKGRYDIGWDAVRQQRFERQKKLGIVPPDAQLSPRDPEAKPWDEMSAEEKAALAHRMEIYAAQIDCIDQNVGRLINKLQELNQLENTLIVFLSDNGCSAEGGPGGFNRGQPDAPIGTALSYSSLGLQWANVADTPLRKFKISTHEGGISTACIAHWPAAIKPGRLVNQPAHVIDVMPTLLDVAGATYPSQRNGKKVLPPEGISLKPWLLAEDAGPAGKLRPLFWEHMGNKAVRLGDWKAVADFRHDWKLYNLANDRIESENLADKHPEKLQELVALWNDWAKRCGVVNWNRIQRIRRNAENAQ